MLPSELTNKPLHSWTVEDLNLIVTRQSEESQFLELKGQLTLANDAKGWVISQKLHRSEKDGLAKEIVALANAYGGHIIVGIDESDDNPKRAAKLATPIPRLADCLESLRTSLGDLIDPPINALTFQPISEDAVSDAGYFVIKVPQSIHTPHGYGSPPAAFVRRADKSEPMTMRDMQNVFWESRTRRERIDNEVEAFGSRFHQNKVDEKYFAFGFCAVSEYQTEIPDVLEYLRSRDGEREFGLKNLFLADNAYSEGPSNYRNWMPTSCGVAQSLEDFDSFHRLDHKNTWLIDDNGCISLNVFSEGLPPQNGHCYGNDRDSPGRSIRPGNIVESFKQFLDLVRLVSFASQPFSTRWIVKGFFKSGHSDFYFPTEHGSLTKRDFTEGMDFRPIAIDLENTLAWPDFLERRIWESLGSKCQNNRNFVLRDTLAKHWSGWAER